ncbi:MAG: hypothetical protein ACKVKR_06805, partial [Pseudomonadales bacterium]
GVLGRSKTYGAILRYLVECSLNGKTPKEAAIAVDVRGRDANFDVSKDSVVRVHIYHLRNKINLYYSSYGIQESYRLEIPKGQYIITTSVNTEAEEPASSITGKPLDRPSYTPWLAALVVILLILKFVPGNEPDGSAVPVSTLSTIQPWQPFLDDDLPILLVIGDYYIFGEVDESGNILRMVREFDINSRGELTRFQQRQPEIASNYYNLDLSYIPVSIANAMVRLVPVLGSKADQLSVKMMSELETADLANNHLIYLGYLSGVDTLLDLMFADSGLSIGATYDELINLETNEYYIGSSGVSGGENFQDYGMVSTFPAPNGNHFLLIAGMRDEGLVNIAQQMTSPESLAILMDTFRGETPVSFEALYEVFGFDNTNFGGELVYSRSLDTQVIWEARLIKN